jgi:hypothetical protein
MGNKFNYIIAMYYNFNVEKLGKKKAIVYANKYINHIQLGCRYSNQAEVNKLCPDIVKEPLCVPEFFINMIKNIN